MPRFARIDDAVIHHDFRDGTGRAVVFLNSLGTDFRLWDAVLDLLPEDIPVLRLDKRGHGLSSLAPVTIPRLAEDAAALMDRYGLREAAICGVSVGGLVAQQLAATRPDLAAALMLMCTGLKIGTPEIWTPRIATARAEGVEPLADAILQRWFSPAFRRERADALEGWRAMLVRTPGEGYARVSEAIRDIDLTAQSPKLALPVHCIAGSEDGSTPPDLVRTLADAVPGATYELIEGAGHLPCIETPDRVADALRAMLARS